VLVSAGVGPLAVVLVLVLAPASLAASAEVPPLVVFTCVDEDVAPELTCCMKTDKHAHIITTLLEQCRALHTTDMAVGGGAGAAPALAQAPAVLSCCSQSLSLSWGTLQLSTAAAGVDQPQKMHSAALDRFASLIARVLYPLDPCWAHDSGPHVSALHMWLCRHHQNSLTKSRDRSMIFLMFSSVSLSSLRRRLAGLKPHKGTHKSRLRTETVRAPHPRTPPPLCAMRAPAPAPPLKKRIDLLRSVLSLPIGIHLPSTPSLVSHNRWMGDFVV
jgi:hypothetical protein